MMEGSGMVAVVRSLRDAGLAVTLLDKGRQYTLCPRNALDNHSLQSNLNAGATQMCQPSQPFMAQPSAQSMPQPFVHTCKPHNCKVHSHMSNMSSSEWNQPRKSTGVITDSLTSGLRHERASQAVDDHYTSVYQTTHCRVQPTSPVSQVTEFPPQPKQLCPGKGNFVVGGPGSGDSMQRPVKVRDYRGAMVWPDRGSVFARLASQEPDPFASSLRRYPSISPERSTEIVERLINYTQARGFARSPIRSYATRTSGTESSSSHYHRSSSPRRRHEESPTRDRDRDRPRKEKEDDRKGMFYNEYDVRYLKDSRSKRHWKPCNSPCVSCNQSLNLNAPDYYLNSNMVNTEIQTACSTSDRKVSTSRDKSNDHNNVAVHVFPEAEGGPPGAPQPPPAPQPSPDLYQYEASVKFASSSALNDDCNVIDHKEDLPNESKVPQQFTYYATSSLNPKVKLTQSSVDLLSNEANEHKTLRKSRSETDSSKSNKEEIVEWLRDICNINKTRAICSQLTRIAEKLKKPGAEKKLREKIEKYLKKIPSYFSEGDKDGIAFRQQLPDNIVRNIKNIYERQFNNTFDLYRFEVRNFYSRDDIDLFKYVIKNWLKPLNIDKERLDRYRHVKKEDIYNFLVYRLEPFILHKRSNPEYRKLLKAYILEIVNDLPIIADRCRKEYIEKISEDLTNNLFKLDIDRARRNTNLKGTKSSLRLKKSNNAFKRYNHAKKVNEFIADQLTKLIDNKVLNVNKRRLVGIEMELRDIFLIVMDYKDLNMDVNKCIKLLLMYVGKVPKELAKEASENIMKEFAKLYESLTGETRDFEYKPQNISQLYTDNCSVYPCEVRKNDYDGIHNNKINTNDTFDTDSYVQKVESVIKAWLSEFGIDCDHTEKIVAINDLAGDIADRKKYLQINSSKATSQEDEIKNLKYQMFKWLGNVLASNDFDVTERASELMERINKISPPVVKPPSKLFNDEVMKIFSEHLFDQIYDWFYDELRYVGDGKSKKMLVQNLVDRITQDKEKGDIQRRINEVVDVWNAELLQGRTRAAVTKRLKDRIKGIVDNFIQYEEKEILRVDKAEVSLQINPPKCNSAVNTDLTEDLIEEELNKFVIDIENQILDWLKHIGVKINQNSLKKVAVRDLAWEILERYKYVRKNPSSKISKEEELEILKYQVYKFMKIVDKSELRHSLPKVSNLMDRIKLVSPPIHATDARINSFALDVRSPSNFSDSEDECKQVTAQLKWQIQANSRAQMAGGILVDPISINESLATGTSLGSMGVKDFINTNLSTINEASVSNNSSCYCEESLGDGYINVKCNLYKNCKGYNTSLKKERDDAFDQADRLAIPFCDYNSSSHCKISTNKINKQRPVPNINLNNSTNEMYSKIDNSESEYYLPNNMTVYEVYQYFDKIFKTKCAELPIVTTNKEEKTLSELAKQGIYNGIWKTFFRYKSDPEINHNYNLFEKKVNTHLDFMLNCLPRTREVERKRNEWKQKIVALNSLMLRYVHSLTDLPTFRFVLAEKFGKEFMKAHHIEDDRYYALVTYVAKCFVVYTSYRCDIMQSSFYRQKLVDILQELASYIKANFEEYKNVTNKKLCEKAFDILYTTTLPSEEIINYEAKEILLEEEIELWYLELPTKPIANTTDQLIRARMKEILAKNLHRIEIKSPDADSKLNKWRQEIQRFLEKDAKLRQDYFDTSFMIDTLVSRLNTVQSRGHSNVFAQSRKINNTGLGPSQVNIRHVCVDCERNNNRSHGYMSSTRRQGNARMAEVVDKYRVSSERSRRR